MYLCVLVVVFGLVLGLCKMFIIYSLVSGFTHGPLFTGTYWGYIRIYMGECSFTYQEGRGYVGYRRISGLYLGIWRKMWRSS